MRQSLRVVFDNYINQERQTLYVQLLQQQESIQAKDAKIQDLQLQIDGIKKMMTDNNHLYKIPDVTMYGGPKPEILSRFQQLRQENQEILLNITDKDAEIKTLKSTIKKIEKRVPNIEDIKTLVVEQSNIMLIQARNQMTDQEAEIKNLKLRNFSLEEQLKFRSGDVQTGNPIEIENLKQQIQEKNQQLEAFQKLIKEQTDQAKRSLELYNSLLKNQKSGEGHHKELKELQEKYALLELENKQLKQENFELRNGPPTEKKPKTDDFVYGKYLFRKQKVPLYLIL